MSLEDFARSYTEAWCSQDPARVAEHYAADGSLAINGGEPAVGRAELTEVGLQNFHRNTSLRKRRIHSLAIQVTLWFNLVKAPLQQRLDIT